MRQILSTQQPQGWETFRCSNGWLAGFKTRFKITSQSATNKKKVPIATKLPLIKAFHMWLLRDLQMSLPSGSFACMCHPDVCYGFILLHNFYNMHQLFSM
jgi:hypothetical protein